MGSTISEWCRHTPSPLREKTRRGLHEKMQKPVLVRPRWTSRPARRHAPHFAMKIHLRPRKSPAQPNSGSSVAPIDTRSGNRSNGAHLTRRKGRRMSSTLDQIRDQQRATWDRFSAGWKKWDELVLSWLAPFGEAMIRRANLQDDSQVLDVAAGTGEPGLTAARLVPHGRVTVTDLSERMLAVAAENAARHGLRNFETRTCDAGVLPFPDASFDAVLCRFGFMFFPDVKSAAREFARVAKPGARVCAAVWSAPDKNPWATTIMGTIARHVEMPPPPPGSPGLFRCAPEGTMRRAFDDAGLRDVNEEEVATLMVHETPDHYWQFMTEIAAPVVAGLATADAHTREQIRTEALEVARRSMRDGTVQMLSTATVIVGTR